MQTFPRGAHPEAERRRAVAAFRKTGSLRKAAQECGIPWQTLAAWKCRHPHWWNSLMNPGETLARLKVELEALETTLHERFLDGRHIFTEERARLRELCEEVRKAEADLEQSA